MLKIKNILHMVSTTINVFNKAIKSDAETMLFMTITCQSKL